MNPAPQNKIQRILASILFPITLTVLVVAAHPAWSRPHPDAMPAAAPAPGARVDTLGKVNFPTSCAPHVQSQIEEGVALLHSFQYRQAKNTFTGESKQQPH